MFADRLKKLRLSKKLSQQYMADLLGITRQGYAKYEKTEKGSQPDFETLQKLADFFETTTDYLLGTSDKPQLEAKKYTTDFNPLEEINKIIKNLGLEEGASGFFDIEKWKNFGPEDVEEIRRHFEWVAHKAKEKRYNPEENDTDGL